MQGMEKVNDDFYIDRSKQLGKGNYGVVFKGYHLSENRIIAVKFMEKKMLDKIPEHEREINVMSELAKLNHPNIMGYYGYEKNEKGLFFFVEFCSGGSLKAIMKKKVSQLKVMTLFHELIDAMTYINKLSISLFIKINFTEILNLTTFYLMKTSRLRLLILDWLEMLRFK